MWICSVNRNGTNKDIWLTLYLEIRLRKGAYRVHLNNRYMTSQINKLTIIFMD
jgi:hypothetical protein